MEQQVQQVQKDSAMDKANRLGTKLAIVATPVLFSAAAFAADESAIEIGTLAITGLASAAASVFAIKASPSLMMWGYRKILGFIGR